MDNGLLICVAIWFSVFFPFIAGCRISSMSRVLTYSLTRAFEFQLIISLIIFVALVMLVFYVAFHATAHGIFLIRSLHTLLLALLCNN